ncbi:TPA: hypothetical protein NJL84_002446 [Pseudomonas aeruginosa]|nr:hypothetical protein [Pseudomonas aeruginosa]HCG0587505.1 hypothetical protein [Pseudomonas aeruginosa]HCG0696387.1 hypothetical protein [Pseudomonas aeruginosa]HCG1134520.1 hypothetical protein [Pseudomonas aeruginosa]HCG1400268.1 hypothetical protein [Pseudomonas aeruginosa]
MACTDRGKMYGGMFFGSWCLRRISVLSCLTMFAGMIHKPWSAPPPATIRTPRRPKDGLNNGLKSRGLEWISVDIIGSSQKKKLFLFNGLKRSVDVLGNPWIDGVERAKGIEPSKTGF